MNDREKMLLEILLSNGPITIQEAAAIFGVTERTIRNSLEEIDSFLMNHQISSLKKKTTTTIAFDGDPTYVANLLKKTNSTGALNYWIEPSLRENFIFGEIALGYKRFTIEQFEVILQTSKSTIHNGIRSLKKRLAEEDIFLEFNQKKGFYLRGNEINIRKRYINNLLYLEQCQIHSNHLDDETKKILKVFVKKLEDANKKELAYNSFFKFIAYLNITIQRIKNGHTIQNLTNPMHKELQLQHVNDCKHLLENFFDIKLDIAEISEINNIFQASHIIKDDYILNGYHIKFKLLAKKFTYIVGGYLKINLSSSEELLNNLMIHFQTTINRYHIGQETAISSETVQSIKSNYLDIFQYVAQAIQQLPELKQYCFDTEENIVLLTLHVVSIIDQLKKTLEKQMHVLLICHLGIGTSQFLNFRLKDHFQFETALGSISNIDSLFKKPETQYAIVLSTVDIPELNGEYLRVSPYLTDVDIKFIQAKVTYYLQQQLQKDYITQQKGDTRPMLKDLLVSETIQTNVIATDWEDAIQKSGQFLIDTHAVEQQYVANMIRAVHEFGPYIVVAPGIALAHASSKNGVHKIAMSLITLADGGVEFGSRANDPVHTVISLATIDHDTHLLALSELVQLIGNEDFNLALKSGDKDIILSMIQKN